MYKYLQFDIEALDNLKLGKFERDANNEYTHSYISGSVIKGAIIWDVAQRKTEVPKDLLNGDTIFYNAYPLLGDIPAIPMMQGYVGDKQEIRSNGEKVTIKHSFNSDIGENIIPYRNYEFIAVDKEDPSKVYGYNTPKIENLHINKKDSKDNKTGIFRYEAIKKGEFFRGYVRVDEKYAEDIINIFKKEIIYFGGSRGSGYGKCKISNIKYVSDACQYKSDLNIKKDLYIYFLSDAILYYNGRVNTYIPTNVLKEKLNIKGKCEYKESYSSLNMSATYNSLYNTNTICYSAVSKGTVLKYEIDEEIDPDKIKGMVNKGIGIRKEDGNGQIAILGKIQDTLTVSQKKKDESIENTDFKFAKEDKEFINIILKNIFDKRSDLYIRTLVLDLIRDKKTPKGSLQSQIGKLLNIFQNGIYKSQDEFKEYIKNYLEHMEGKKGKDIWQRLNKFSVHCNTSKYNIERISIQKMLTDFIDNKTNSIFEALENMKNEGVKLGKFKFPDSNESDEVLYQLKMKFFIVFFKYCIRTRTKEVGQ